VTEAARLLLVAAVLTASGLAAFSWRLTRIDAAEPGRLIGELRLAHWMALLLAGTGGAWIGLAVGHGGSALDSLEVLLAVATMVAAMWTLHRDTRSALMGLAVAFLVHAILDAAHRPGGLTVDLAPRWFTLGCAVFNLCLSAMCFWVQRR
jgi:uncharacterized membrane protein YhdT